MPPRINLSANSTNRIKGITANIPTMNEHGVGPSQSNNAVKQKQRREQILADLADLPSLPRVVTEILELARNPKTNTEDFEKPFHQDQALTAKLLRLANSSFFGLTHEVTSISRAIVVLGFSTLKSLVMASTAGAYLARPMAVYGYSAEGLWQHAVLCAGLSKHLGERFFDKRGDDAEALFISGLLHDIGKIILAPHLTREVAELKTLRAQRPQANIIELEQQIMGIDHAELGGIIARHWKLGDDLAVMIERHHNDDLDPKDDLNLAIVLLADLLAVRQQAGINETYPWIRRTPQQLIEGLGLEGERLNQIKIDVHRVFEDVQPMFNLN